MVLLLSQPFVFIFHTFSRFRFHQVLILFSVCRLGNDLEMAEVNTMNDCCGLCTAKTGCKAWNFERCKSLGCDSKCYLKSAAVAQGDKVGTTAGKLSM
jgi:hypothetical protein